MKNKVENTQDDQKLTLDPNEIAFRKIYKHLIEEEKITTIFRPEKRLCGDWRGYCENQEATIQIIDKIGADWALVAPKFMEGFSKKVLINNVETKKLSELTPFDFSGSSPDIHNRESLKYHLGVIYNISDEEFTDDFIVTKTTFDYV